MIRGTFICKEVGRLTFTLTEGIILLFIMPSDRI